jgi:hypothetical protein
VNVVLLNVTYEGSLVSVTLPFSGIFFSLFLKFSIYNYLIKNAIWYYVYKSVKLNAYATIRENLTVFLMVSYIRGHLTHWITCHRITCEHPDMR